MTPSDPLVRLARSDDLDGLIDLFADDVLGGHGDTADPAERPRYALAFERILANPADRLFVVEAEGRVIGTALLTLLDGLTHRGRRSGLVRQVQVAADRRGGGIGALLMAAAIGAARAEGAGVIGLTSNLARTDAHRFYERLGFVRSHAGFKRSLDGV